MGYFLHTRHGPNEKEDDEDDKDGNEVSESRDEIQELNNRRGILKFNIKSSSKN